MNKAHAPTDVIHDWKGWMVFIFLAFIWGGSFILIKKGLIYFSAIDVAAARIFLASVAFVPVLWLSGVAIPKGKILLITVIIFIGNGLPAFMFALAETRLGSAVTGVLNSLTPIFTVLLAIFFFNARFKYHYVVGILCGCAGIGLLVAGERDWRIGFYVLYVILGTICYGFAVNLIKLHGQGIHPISFTAVGFIALGPPSAAVLGWTGAFEKMMEAAAWQQSMPALLGLALLCTVMANVLFNWLIQRTNAIFSSAIAYAIPCMALVWGGLDGEMISWFQLSGFVFILFAVYILRKQ